jgi:hypothetical protein
VMTGCWGATGGPRCVGLTHEVFFLLSFLSESKVGRQGRVRGGRWRRREATVAEGRGGVDIVRWWGCRCLTERWINEGDSSGGEIRVRVLGC